MARPSASEVISGRAPGLASALTWVPPAALRALVWGSDVSGEAETRAAACVALGVDVAFVDASSEHAGEQVGALAAVGVGAVWAVTGVLGRVADVAGWAQTLRDTATSPGALAQALDRALHDALDDLRRGCALGVEAVVIADDLAAQSGWLVSPDFALEALMPSYRRLAHEAAECSAVAAFHSDGDVRALYPALARAGFSAVHLAGVDAATMAASVRSARAHGLTPVGGIGVGDLTARGAAAVGADAGALAAGGPLVVADDGGFSDGAELAWLRAAFEAARHASGLQR